MSSKKIFGLIFASLIFLSVFASLFVGLVSAQDNGEGNRVGPTVIIEKISGVFDPVKDMFSKWEEGELSVNIAKYFIWILVILFVYSIIAFIPVIKNLHGGAKFLLAIIVGFLSTAYMTTSDVYTALAGYSALGLVLSAILPLVILLGFSIETHKEGGVGGRLITKFMWLIFIVFLVWKLVDGVFGISNPNNAKLISPWEGFAYIGVILFALIWIWFGERKFIRMLYKEESTALLEENLQDVIHVLVAEISQREERSKNLSGAAQKSYDVHTNNLRDRLKEAQRKLGK